MMIVHRLPSRNHYLRNNKQAYSHCMQLPEDRSGWIRLSFVFKLSGSVPRTRNKQSGNIGRWAAGHDQGAEYNI